MPMVSGFRELNQDCLVPELIALGAMLCPPKHEIVVLSLEDLHLSSQ